MKKKFSKTNLVVYRFKMSPQLEAKGGFINKQEIQE